MRFASVYRQFEDVQAFHDEIERLRSARASVPAARPQTPAHRRRAARAASRDQLPLLPAEPAREDGEPGAGGKQ